MNTSLCLALGQWPFLCAWTKSRLPESNAEESVLVPIIYSRADVYTRGERNPPECAGAFDYCITSLFQDGISNFIVGTWSFSVNVGLQTFNCASAGV